MKVILVCGSPHEKGCTYTALQEIAQVLEKENIELAYPTETVHVRNVVDSNNEDILKINKENNVNNQ